MTGRTDAKAGTAVVVDEATVSFGDGWDNDDGTGARAADKSGQGVVIAFGQSMKALRVRAGLEREEFGRRLGYSTSSVASFEQERRIPSPRTIELADEVLGAGGLPTVWKEQVERAQYPVFFQGDRPGTDGSRRRSLWDYPITGSHSARVNGVHRRVVGIAMNNAESSTVASDLAWFKSSYSGTEGGQCLEIAAGTGVVHVRDSKDVAGPVVRASRETWTGFLGLASSVRGV